MQDICQRFMFEHAPIRGELVRLGESYRTIVHQHHYPSVIRELLGEALVAAVLLTEVIKFNGELTLQFQSDGPVTLLVAKCNSQGMVRGLATWRDDVLPINIPSALGEGQLVVTISYDEQVKPYQSVIPIRHQTISQALEVYFIQSEQLPTRLYVAVSAEAVSGLLLQMLPNESSETLNETWEEAVILADTLNTDELLTLDHSEILRRLYHEHDIRLFDARSIAFKCRCSPERMAGAILALGEAEAAVMLQTNKEIVVTCEYCNNIYGFDKAQVLDIFAEHEK